MASEIGLSESFVIFGRELATSAIISISDVNLALEKAGTPVDTSELLTSMATIQDLLNAGSLKTARTLLDYVAPNFPTYLDILEGASASITDFLIGNGEEEEPEDY